MDGGLPCISLSSPVTAMPSTGLIVTSKKGLTYYEVYDTVYDTVVSGPVVQEVGLVGWHLMVQFAWNLSFLFCNFLKENSSNCTSFIIV